MFISSYSTYIGLTSSDKTKNSDFERLQDESKNFGSKLSKIPALQTQTEKTLPIDYVFNYKSFANQQKLQAQTQAQSELKFTEIKTMKNAKTAYEESSKIFSFVKKPHVSLNQTPLIDEKLPQEIQELQKKNLREKMINTYQQNNRYYQITAA